MPIKVEDKEVEGIEFYWHNEHQQALHEGLGCIGGKYGGTPSALRCLTSLYAAHKGTIEGK